MPTNIGENIASLATEAVDKFPDDIDKGVEFSVKKLNKAPFCEELKQYLFTRTMRDAIAEERHKRNVKMKKDRGEYGGAAKVVMINERTQRHYDVYTIAIGGRLLGSLTGKELLPMAANEEIIGNGHLRNAELLRRLAEIVPQDKQVRMVVKQTKLSSIINEIWGSESPDEDAA